jgi:hypothetical protein
MSDLYESDIILWSEHQAEALRRLQAGERRNDVDWDHLIDEVLTVGRNELHAVESLLQRAIEHLLKAAGWPDAQTVPHWLAEADGFLARARRRYTPSMAQRLDLPGIYADALRNVLRRRYDGAPPQPLVDACPLALEELFTADVVELAGRARRH